MRIRRIEQITSTGHASIRLHDEITVVSGLDRLGREALALELISAIGEGRPGLSADLLMSNGRHLALRRPHDHPSFVNELDQSDPDDVDASMDLRNPRGQLDPMTALGIDRPEHRQAVRIGSDDVRAARLERDQVAMLANMDHAIVWTSAQAIVDLDAALRETAVESRRFDDWSAAVDQRIEVAHERVESLADRGGLDDVELMATTIASTAMGLAAALLSSIFAALPFFVIAAGLGVWRELHRRAVRTARQNESEALHAAGVGTYLDHQLRLVDGLTGAPEERARTLALVEQRERELDRWSELVGAHANISPRHALDLRPEVEAMADVPPSHLAPSAVVVETIRRHVDWANATAREPLPLILDDPFDHVDDESFPDVTTALCELAEDTQLIVLSNDERMVTWAHRLADAGRAHIVELSDAAPLDDAPPLDAVLLGDARRAGTVDENTPSTQPV